MRPLVVAALGCALTAGRVGGSEGPVGFSAGPKVAVGKDGVRIEFAASRATDVAVEILDAKGGTVRHLAAGVLGKNAPEPLGKGMAQSLVWDRKDDLGKDVPAGNYSVRVGLGLKPALGKIENFEPLNAGEVLGLAGLPGGGVCILNRGGYPDFLPRLIVLGRDGAYVRQIFPPPAGLEPEKSPGIRFFRRGDGCWVPILGEVMPRPKDSPPFCPMAAGGGSLAVVPFGASALRLFDTGTGALAAPVAADSLGQGRGKLSPRGLAMSPDGKWFYLTGIEADGRQIRALHAVYRLPSDGSVPLRPLAGDPGKPGKGETFFDTPIGLAADKDGNILVGDSGNDRVAVFSADGRFLRAVEVRSPVFVGAMPGGGFVALSAGAPPSPARTFPAGGARLLRFGADGRQLAGEDLKTPRGVGKLCATGLAVDASKDPAIVWLSLAGEAGETGAGALLRWECRGTGLAALDPIVTSYRRPQTKGPYDPRYLYGWGINDGSYIKYREAFDWKYLADEGMPFYSFGPLDQATGLWADGRRYGWKGGNTTWYQIRDKWPEIGFLRFGADGKPLPFETTGTNELKLVHEPQAPWYPQRGAMVDRRGHVYLRYSWKDAEAIKNKLDGRNQWVTGILHYDERGTLVGEIALTHGTYGLGVDARGSIYVGDKPRPAGILVPADIEKAFDGKVPESISGWYGSVIKFGPKGGRFVFKSVKGRPRDLEARRPGDLFRPPLKTMDADIGPWLNGGEQADIEGAEWVWVGMSPMVSTRACICYGTSLAVDPHGRVFVPDKMACRVAVLDAGGNIIRYIGGYGNMDSRGKDSSAPDPEIAFAQVRMVTAATGRQVRVADNGNNWVSVVSLGYETEATVPVVVAR